MAKDAGSLRPKIAMLGLGSMGSTLANTLLQAGHDLTVWNRGPERRERFRGKCAVAETAEQACEAAELILCCFASYAAGFAALDNDAVKKALVGKTLIQMGTATIEEAEQFGTWSKDNGIGFLDAKIATTPAQIGADMTVIFYAGPRNLFDRYKPQLNCLGGRTTHVGEKIDAAVLGDFAFLSVYFAGVVGSLHGAAFCGATGMNLNQYFDLTKSFLNEVDAQNNSFRTMILNRDYSSEVHVALNTDLGGAIMMEKASKYVGLQGLFSESLVAVFQDAVNRGYGTKDSAALFEAFQAK